MPLQRTTLSKFLAEQLVDHPDASDICALLADVAASTKAIASMVSKGALGGYLGSAGSENVQGETQKKLDIITNDAMIEFCEPNGLLCGMASEELDDPYPISKDYKKGRYIMFFDPLDGSSNIDVNVSVGTIFSIFEHERSLESNEELKLEEYLRKGLQQIAAGYALYGPSTMLVLTVGKGSHGFTLDDETGNYILTHPDLQVTEDTSEFAINASNERFWEPPVQRYIGECKAGKNGVREREFNMRWVASMVAEIHRILIRGGVFLYPRDSRESVAKGKLRLMYEANPMAMVIEQAGGLATTGREPIMGIAPSDIHQRVPVMLGSKNEIERIVRYHQQFDDGEDEAYHSPLLNDRGLLTDS